LIKFPVGSASQLLASIYHPFSQRW
jgi:hypothetical protein